MLKKPFLIVITLLLSSLLLNGQPYYFSNYTVENGLSSNNVFSSLQDHKGFMWFGTIDGLNRFDGYTFKVFRPDRDHSGNISSNNIIALCEDHNDVLWVGTTNGLYRFDARYETFALVKPTLGEGITNLHADRSGNIWFMAQSRVHRYTPRSRKLMVFDYRGGIDASSLCIDPDGIPWIGTSTGLIRKLDIQHHTIRSYTVFGHSQPGRSRNIPLLYDTGKQYLLVGTSNQGVKLFNKHSGSYEDILTHNKHKAEIYVRDFIHNTGDEYWVASELGIFICNLSTKQSTNLVKDHSNPYSLSDNAIYTLCKDKEGGIWAGSFFGGVNYYPRQHNLFEKFFPSVTPGSISGNAVREICKDKYGNIWVGTEDASLNKLDPATGRFTVFAARGAPTDVSYTNIHGLLAVDNELWIGTFEHGLDVMDIRTGKVIRRYEYGTRPGSLKSNFIITFCGTRNGRIYVGTTNGLFLYNPLKDNFMPVKLHDEVPEPFIYSIMEDRKGTVWVGTLRDGTFRINPRSDSISRFLYDRRNPERLRSNRVSGLFESTDGTIWLTIEGEGLCRFSPANGSFRSYTVHDGFPSSFVFRVLEDSSHNLWVSTSKGLVCFDPVSEKTKIFTKSNGLLNDQFNYNSAFRDTATGDMYFGSVKGLIRFNPDKFTTSTYIPPVYITGIEVDNKELAIGQPGSPLKISTLLTDTIVLRHDQSSFNIQFAALSYTAPGTTEYEYTTTGLDTGWIRLKTNRHAYFTGLQPGTYTFRVRAANSSGIWSDNTARLVIKILPPFWKSGTAYTLYTILTLACIGFMIREFDQRTKKRNRRKLELLAHKKEKEVYQAKIDFFTNVAHEIRTPLTLIKGPMEKIIKRVEQVPDIRKNLMIMERNTGRLLELTEQLLDFRRVETGSFSLDFTDADICLLLKDLHQRFQPAAEQKKISFRLEIPKHQIIARTDTEAFNKIVSNLTSNAIKYCKRHVVISLSDISETGNRFSVKVKNDGNRIPPEMKDKIFDPFVRMPEARSQSGSGLGLSLSLSLAQLLQGTLSLDDQDSNMNVFILTLPLLPGNEQHKTK